ncbi:hypothetical protein HK102_006298 [Quaeritorhiza haematococci]|nr:hypothetical protein HK102_006298 [Quaeritorhiza haematococci]
MFESDETRLWWCVDVTCTGNPALNAARSGLRKEKEKKKKKRRDPSLKRKKEERVDDGDGSRWFAFMHRGFGRRQREVWPFPDGHPSQKSAGAVTTTATLTNPIKANSASPKNPAKSKGDSKSPHSPNPQNGLKSGVDWLVEAINSNLTQLTPRISADVRKQEERYALEREERRRRVELYRLERTGGATEMQMQKCRSSFLHEVLGVEGDGQQGSTVVGELRAKCAGSVGGSGSDWGGMGSSGGVALVKTDLKTKSDLCVAPPIQITQHSNPDLRIAVPVAVDDGKLQQGIRLSTVTNEATKDAVLPAQGQGMVQESKAAEISPPSAQKSHPTKAPASDQSSLPPLNPLRTPKIALVAQLTESDSAALAKKGEIGVSVAERPTLANAVSAFEVSDPTLDNQSRQPGESKGSGPLLSEIGEKKTGQESKEKPNVEKSSIHHKDGTKENIAEKEDLKGKGSDRDTRDDMRQGSRANSAGDGSHKRGSGHHGKTSRIDQNPNSVPGASQHERKGKDRGRKTSARAHTHQHHEHRHRSGDGSPNGSTKTEHHRQSRKHPRAPRPSLSAGGGSVGMAFDPALNSISSGVPSSASANEGFGAESELVARSALDRPHRRDKDHREPSSSSVAHGRSRPASAAKGVESSTPSANKHIESELRSDSHQQKHHQQQREKAVIDKSQTSPSQADASAVVSQAAVTSSPSPSPSAPPVDASASPARPLSALKSSGALVGSLPPVVGGLSGGGSLMRKKNALPPLQTQGLGKK